MVCVTLIAVACSHRPNFPTPMKPPSVSINSRPYILLRSDAYSLTAVNNPEPAALFEDCKGLSLSSQPLRVRYAPTEISIIGRGQITTRSRTSYRTPISIP